MADIRPSATQQAAEHLISEGFTPIALLPRSKAAVVEWGRYQDPSCKPTHRDLEDWWARYPNANVGIVLGRASRAIVVDVDEPKLLDSTEYPLTPSARIITSRGFHVYYAIPPGCVVPTRELPFGDLKGEGAYVVAPPSIHPDGSSYRGDLRRGNLKPAPAWARSASSVASTCGTAEPVYDTTSILDVSGSEGPIDSEAAARTSTNGRKRARRVETLKAELETGAAQPGRWYHPLIHGGLLMYAWTMRGVDGLPMLREWSIRECGDPKKRQERLRDLDHAWRLNERKVRDGRIRQMVTLPVPVSLSGKEQAVVRAAIMDNKHIKRESARIDTESVLVAFLGMARQTYPKPFYLAQYDVVQAAWGIGRGDPDAKRLQRRVSRLKEFVVGNRALHVFDIHEEYTEFRAPRLRVTDAWARRLGWLKD